MSGDAPWAVLARFSPPSDTSGIVLYRASTEGSSCDVSANAADPSCLVFHLSGGRRYSVHGVACAENGECSSRVQSFGYTIPDRKEIKF